MTGPRVLSYGLGVDSTALLIELHARGTPPDLVLTADPGSEKYQSLETLEIMRDWMAERQIPYKVVRYEVTHYRQAPPYSTLVESLLINGCLPSIAFGSHTCSQRFKISPQDKLLRSWPPALEAWARGEKVTKIIGLDAGPRDTIRYAHARSRPDDPRFNHEFPLQTWGWDREACKRRIAEAGLPIPVKSSCVFCSGMQVPELEELPPRDLRLIILLEARARPRLTTTEGLWRKSTRTRPGRMTDHIVAHALLPEEQVRGIETDGVNELKLFLAEMAKLDLAARTPMRTWLENFEARYSATRAIAA